MRLLCGPIFLGLILAVSATDEMISESAPEPFETSELDMRMAEGKVAVEPHHHQHSNPEPQPEPEPEPHPIPEPEPHPHAEPEPEPSPSAEPTPEPEPAIKFDNVENEDYGDVAEVVSPHSLFEHVFQF